MSAEEGKSSAAVKQRQTSVSSSEGSLGAGQRKGSYDIGDVQLFSPEHGNSSEGEHSSYLSQDEDATHTDDSRIPELTDNNEEMFEDGESKKVEQASNERLSTSSESSQSGEFFTQSVSDTLGNSFSRVRLEGAIQLSNDGEGQSLQSNTNLQTDQERDKGTKPESKMGYTKEQKKNIYKKGSSANECVHKETGEQVSCGKKPQHPSTSKDENDSKSAINDENGEGPVNLKAYTDSHKAEIEAEWLKRNKLQPPKPPPSTPIEQRTPPPDDDFSNARNRLSNFPQSPRHKEGGEQGQGMRTFHVPGDQPRSDGLYNMYSPAHYETVREYYASERAENGALDDLGPDFLNMQFSTGMYVPYPVQPPYTLSPSQYGQYQGQFLVSTPALPGQGPYVTPVSIPSSPRSDGKRPANAKQGIRYQEEDTGESGQEQRTGGNDTEMMERNGQSAQSESEGQSVLSDVESGNKGIGEDMSNLPLGNPQMYSAGQYFNPPPLPQTTWVETIIQGQSSNLPLPEKNWMELLETLEKQHHEQMMAQYQQHQQRIQLLQKQVEHQMLQQSLNSSKQSPGQPNAWQKQGNITPVLSTSSGGQGSAERLPSQYLTPSKPGADQRSDVGSQYEVSPSSISQSNYAYRMSDDKNSKPRAGPARSNSPATTMSYFPTPTKSELDQSEQLWNRLSKEHKEAVARLEGEAGKEQVSSSVQGAQMGPSTVRVNLQEKHMRHLADLKVYYEREIEELQRQLSSPTVLASRSPYKSLVEQNQRLQRQCEQYEAKLAEGKREITALEQKLEAVETKLLEWNRKYEKAQESTTTLQLKYDQLTVYARQQDASVQALTTKNTQLTAALEEAYRLQDMKNKNYKREQEILEKILKEYESLGKQHERVKENLNAAENNLHDVKEENLKLRKYASKLDLEVQRLARENDQLRRRAISPVLGLTLSSSARSYPSPTVTPRTEPSPYLMTTVSDKGRYLSASPVKKSQENSDRLWQDDSEAGSDDGRPVSPLVKAERELEKRRRADRQNSQVLNNKNSSTSNLPSSSRSVPEGAGANVLHESDGKSSGVKPKAALGPQQSDPRSTNEVRASESAISDTPRSEGFAPSNYDLLEVDVNSERQNVFAKHTLGLDKENAKKNLMNNFTSPTGAAGYTFSRGQTSGRHIQNGFSESGRNLSKISKGSPSPLSPGLESYLSTERKQDRVPALSSTVSERQKIVADMEKRFDELLLEKRQVETQLSHLPSAGGRTCVKNRHNKEELENQLDQIDRELGSVRMALKRYNVLPTHS